MQLFITLLVTQQHLPLFKACDNLKMWLVYVFHVIVTSWPNGCTTIGYYTLHKKIADANRQVVK